MKTQTRRIIRCLAPAVLVGVCMTMVGCAHLQSFKPGVDGVGGHDHIISAARLAERRGDIEEAKKVYQRLIKKGESPGTSHHRLGVIAARQDNLEKALEHFESARVAGNESVDLDIDIAYANLLMGREKSADALLKNALRKEPANKRALNNLAILRAKQGDFEDCLALSRRVVGPAKAHSNVGYLMTQFGDREDAADSFHQALDQDPSLSVAARALLALQRQKPAQEKRSKPAESIRSPAENYRPERTVAQAAASSAMERARAMNFDTPEPSTTIASTATLRPVDLRPDLTALERARAMDFDSITTSDVSTSHALAAAKPRSAIEAARMMDFDSVATIESTPVRRRKPAPRPTTRSTFRPTPQSSIANRQKTTFEDYVGAGMKEIVPTRAPAPFTPIASTPIARTPVSSGPASNIPAPISQIAQRRAAPAQPTRIQQPSIPEPVQQTTLDNVAVEDVADIQPVVSTPPPTKYVSNMFSVRKTEPAPVVTTPPEATSPKATPSEATPSRKTLLTEPPLALTAFKPQADTAPAPVKKLFRDEPAADASETKAVLLSKTPVRLSGSRERAIASARRLGEALKQRKRSAAQEGSSKIVQADTSSNSGGSASRRSTNPLPAVWESKARTPDTP